MLRKEIGIDIGTTQISICTPDGVLLLREPNVAVLDPDTGKVLATGHGALRLHKERKGLVQLCYPARDGVVKHANVLSAILREFLYRALGRTFLRPHALVCVPCDLTEAQIAATEDAVLAAGVSRVHLLETPLCAALGVGFDFSVPTAQMIIHVGASRTEAAVIFLGDMLIRKTAHVGGVHFDEAIRRYMLEKYQLSISGRMAEQIKIRFVRVDDHDDVTTQEVRGRDATTKELRVVKLKSNEMKEALKNVMFPIVDAALSMAEDSADEIRVDIAKGGVVLTGGGVLRGLGQFLADILGVRASVATNADTAAAEGAAKALAKLR